MKVSRSEFDRAASGVVSPGQAEALWGALLEGANGRPRFDLPNVAYYFGALEVVSAMGWFISDAWERFGGWGIFSIALDYAGVFVVASNPPGTRKPRPRKDFSPRMRAASSRTPGEPGVACGREGSARDEDLQRARSVYALDAV
jgi:hypothetical protein